jgi:AAA domain
MSLRKNKTEFLIDASRQACLNSITAHVRRAGSCVITGNYGSGKTELLKQIAHPSAVRVRSLGSLYQVLGSMAGVSEPSWRAKEKYLNQLIAHPRVIIIDEAQHLAERVYPYLKIIMDAGNSIILSGLPDLHDSLRARHPDVLSRMTHLKLGVLSQDEMSKLLPDFTPAAVSVLYGHKSNPNMREMMSIVAICRDYASESKLDVIDVDTVSLFAFEGE